jgi:hypothetical protein
MPSARVCAGAAATRAQTSQRFTAGLYGMAVLGVCRMRLNHAPMWRKGWRAVTRTPGEPVKPSQIPPISDDHSYFWMFRLVVAAPRGEILQQ